MLKKSIIITVAAEKIVTELLTIVTDTVTYGGSRPVKGRHR
jgi:hypothetical protein